MGEKESLRIFYDVAASPEFDFDSQQLREATADRDYTWRVKFDKCNPATVEGDEYVIIVPVRLSVRINKSPAKPLVRMRYRVKMRAPKDVIMKGPDYWIGYGLAVMASQVQSWARGVQKMHALPGSPFTSEEDDIVNGALDFAADYPRLFPGYITKSDTGDNG